MAKIIPIILALAALIAAGCFTETKTVPPIEGQFLNNCTLGEDCILIDSELGYSCCFAGACAQIDYSLEKYVAVNRKDFEQQKAQKCPPETDCGPAPGCPTQIINVDFSARCISNKCQKAAK